MNPTTADLIRFLSTISQSNEQDKGPLEQINRIPRDPVPILSMQGDGWYGNLKPNLDATAGINTPWGSFSAAKNLIENSSPLMSYRYQFPMGAGGASVGASRSLDNRSNSIDARYSAPIANGMFDLTASKSRDMFGNNNTQLQAQYLKEVLKGIGLGAYGSTGTLGNQFGLMLKGTY